MEKIKLSVSTNPAPLDKMFEYIAKLNDSEADFVHCDVMDGKFVENFTYSSSMVKQVKKESALPLDVHLMVQSPSKWTLRKFLKAKPYSLTIHYEVYENKQELIDCLQYIYKKGSKAGLAINPDTKISDVEAVLPYCQFIIVMTVVPGKSGQTIIPDCLNKIKQIRRFYKKLGITDVEVEVDGGVNGENIQKAIDLGYDVVVMGSYIYNQKNQLKAIKDIKSL